MTGALGRSISWTVFTKAIKAGNPRAVLLPSKTTQGAMVYLHLPKHPDSDHRGLWEIMAVPSPTFYKMCPYEDFIADNGKRARGYSQFFRSAKRMRYRFDDGVSYPVFDASRVKKVLPNAYRPWRGALAMKAEALRRATTKVETQARQLLRVSKRIPNYGRPLIEPTRKRIYSFGGQANA